MEPTVHQHVRASLKDAVFTNLAVGMAESYFAAFMLALGLSEVVSGAGKILPMFLGVCAQLFAIRGPFRRMGLKKRAWGFVVVQALVFPLLAMVGLYRLEQAPVVIGLLGLYWAAGLSAIPPWNRLMGETIPRRFWPKFFAHRNSWAQAAVLAGLLLSGGALALAQEFALGKLEVFAVIFLACAVCKLLSVRELWRHRDSPLRETQEVRVRLRDFLANLKGSRHGGLVAFFFGWYVVVQIAGVYFDPYMLGQLKWSPLRYSSIIAISFLGRVLVLNWLKSHIRPRHVPLVLWSGCALVSFTPLCWTFGTAYGWIFVVELMCGAGWAAIELSSTLLFLEKISDHERTSLMTYISFTNTLGMLLGMLIGGWLLTHGSGGEGVYQLMFQLSSVLRVGLWLGFTAVMWRDLRGVWRRL